MTRFYVPRDWTLAQRFAHHADASAGADGCWPWSGHASAAGYGQIRWQRRMLKASRVSWMLAFGPIPDGLFVCHRCDNPPCVNPAHLFLGTHSENMADKIAKGRHARGEKHSSAIKASALYYANTPRGERHSRPHARLGVSQILEIRAATESQSVLARRYSVSQPTINDIRRRRTWTHI